jgi:hypothetical protein
LKSEQSEWEEPVKDEYDSEQAKRDRYTQVRKELQEARSSFTRAQENGAPSWKVIKDIDMRMRRLAEKIQIG